MSVKIPFTRGSPLSSRAISNDDTTSEAGSALYSARSKEGPVTRRRPHTEQVLYGSSIDIVRSPQAARLTYPKSDDTAKFLADTLSKHFFFSSFSSTEIGSIVAAMAPKYLQDGEKLVDAGQVGDALYVVEHGTLEILGSKVEYIQRRQETDFDVSVDIDGAQEVSDSDLDYDDDEDDDAELDVTGINHNESLIKHPHSLHRGDCYGELALMQDIRFWRTLIAVYDASNSASLMTSTITQKSNSSKPMTTVWVLDRSTYRRVIASASDRNIEQIKRTLQQSPLLRHLTPAQLSRVAMAAREVSYEKNEVIIRKGDVGDFMLFIRDGAVRCTDIGTGAKTTADVILGLGACVGERALILAEPRAATVIADIATRGLQLNRHAVTQLLGSLKDVLDHNMAVNVLRSVPVLQALTDRETADLATKLTPVTFNAEEYIVKCSDEGSCSSEKSSKEDEDAQSRQRPLSRVDSLRSISKTFFIVREGRAKLVDVSRKVVGYLESGDYYGETQLLSNASFGCSLVADSRTVTCLGISRADFASVIGNPAAYLVRLPGKVLEDAGLKRTSSHLRVTARYSSEESSISTSSKSSSKHAEVTSSRDAAICAIKPQRTDKVDSIVTGDLRCLQDAAREVDGSLSLDNLRRIQTLGIGTFGRVYMVRDNISNRLFALKALRKAKVIRLKQQRNVVYEKSVMAAVRHPFLLRLYATFQDKQRLYMLMELVQGGELFGYLDSVGLLDSDSARFYTACVFAGIAHLHEREIVYRDLKPENLLLDHLGYLRIVDFGFAKHVPDRTFTLCGTPEYLAPEIVMGNGYGLAVDWWALGILIFEMLSGQSPFENETGDPMATYRAILKGEYDWPDEVEDSNAKSLVDQLLQKSLVDRLGCRRAGSAEIAEHPWLSSINWTDLLEKKIPAPWIPDLDDEEDTRHFEEYEDAGESSDEEDESSLQEYDTSWCKDF